MCARALLLLYCARTLEHGTQQTSRDTRLGRSGDTESEAAGRPAGLPPPSSTAACPTPPLPPILCYPPPQSFHLREHGRSPYVRPAPNPRILAESPLFLQLPHRVAASHTFTSQPPSFSPFLSAAPSSLSPSLSLTLLAWRTCVCMGLTRLCVRVANISRALCSLLPFYEALHDDVHLCPSRRDAGPGALNTNGPSVYTVSYNRFHHERQSRLCILTSSLAIQVRTRGL